MIFFKSFETCLAALAFDLAKYYTDSIYFAATVNPLILITTYDI